ncbi:MAG: DUF4249 family protein, partial [Chitinophagales bacterium]
SGLPPFISLTQTVPFYGEINFNELDNYYAHDAEVIVSDGITTVTLAEFCLSEIDEALIPFVVAYLGLELDSTGSFPVDVCLYTDPNIFTGAPSIIGVPGKIYSLTITYDGKTYTSSTKVPELSYLDSVFVKNQPDPDTDSLYILYGTLTDPDTLGNHYRYLTKRNSEAFYPPFSSVADDLFFNGNTFDFNMARGSAPTEDFDPATSGYFFTGDTIVLKWCTIDRASYDFFRTLEFDSGTDGPFASATIVQTNISDGALGVWCGYGVTYDTVYVTE